MILWTLGFHISTTGYLEEESLFFTDVTDLELTAKSAMVDNPGQVVTHFKDKVMKKKNECTAKKKRRLARFYIPVRSLLSLCPKFSLVLLPQSVPALVPVFVTAFIFRAGLTTILLSAHMPAPAILKAFSLPCHTLVSRCRISTLLSPLPLLGPLLLFSSLRTFKQFLLNKPPFHVSTSPTKPFCLFPALGTYNLDNNNSSYNPTDNNKCKWDFNTAFINSRPFAGNHD